MIFGELIHLLFIDLNALLRKNVVIRGATFQQVLGITAIPFDGIEMTALSKALGIDNSTCTRLIIRLERKEWVKRISSKKDKRVNIVTLTSKGKNIQKILDDQFYIIASKVEDLFPLSRRETIVENLKLFRWNVSKVASDNR